MKNDDLFRQLCRMVVPEQLLTDFNIDEIIESKEEWQVVLLENKDKVPIELKGKDAVLDGFMNAVELFSFPVKDKRLYLKIFRRKWKERGLDQSYWNKYDLHDPGMKTTKEFGIFLKELSR
jgi:hypothetical protein